jgi:predicted O-methyltransferase YrrM
LSGGDQIVWYQRRQEVLQHAAAIAPTDGMILEFGVASGTTIRCLAGSAPLLDRVIYGFDSFQGLPEPWGNYQAGHFACDIPEVPNNVELIVGMFGKTLPQFLETHPGDVALLHLDADLYSSTRTVLEHLSSRIVPGSIVLMDEYFVVPDEEQRAFAEWLAKTNRTCRFEARTFEQLCVVMTS